MDSNHSLAIAVKRMLGLFLRIVAVIGDFIVSAFFAGLFAHPIIRFMHISLDCEHRHRRGDHFPYGSNRPPNSMPRDW